MSERPTFDETWLEIARVISKRAACTRRQVGSVIVDKDNRVISSGYNGAASGEPHCTDGACPRGKLSYDELPADSSYASCIGLHSEANSIVRGGERCIGATLYCTDEPCHECKRLIKAAGIARVVVAE